MTYLADFCAWFQRQQAANRLELLVTLLQMLHPLELRFVSACVEELARKDYYCLREYEIRSNSGQVVAQLTDLGDSGCRSRLVVALSLLYSGNYSTSAILYKTLLNLNAVFHQLPKTKDVVDEIILLLVMAKHHPAFRFDQRADVAEILERIAASMIPDETVASARNEEKREETENEHICSSSIKSVVDCATQVDDEQGFFCTCGKVALLHGGDTAQCSPYQALPYVTNITVKGTRKTENEDIYDLLITWSNKEQTEVTKTLREMYDFHRQLLDSYPKDAGACGSGRKIPYFPGYRALTGYNDGGQMALQNVTLEVYEYIQDLVKLSPDILRSDYTVNFFKRTSPATSPSSAKCKAEPSLSQPAVPKRPCVLDPGSSEEGDCMDANGRVMSLTIYNSHVIPADRRARKSSHDSGAFGPFRQESQAQAVPSTKTSKKSSKAANAASLSKTSESYSATSHTSADLAQSVSTASSVVSSGGKPNSKKHAAASPQAFIPNPLFLVLKQDGLVDDYKQYLYPRNLEDLCSLTECDLTRAGFPLEPCLHIINAAKNYKLATTKHLNGTVIPKFNATDVVSSDVMLLRPSHCSAAAPLLDIRGPFDGTPLVAPVSAMPYFGVSALSVDTNLSTSVSGKVSYPESVDGPTSALSASSNATIQPSETSSAIVSGNAMYEPLMQSVQARPSGFHTNYDAVDSSATSCAVSSNDPSLLSASWIGPQCEDEFPSVIRSYSVDSSDTTTTTTTYVANMNSVSTSLPPSQSQSPAPPEAQQTPFYFPVAGGNVMSTSTTFPSHNSNTGNHHYGHQRNSKSSYRLPSHFKGPPHPSSALQRRNFAPPFDYSRPQLFSFIPPGRQSISGHQMALSTAIPAASFVRAPPPAPVQAPSSQRVRLPCQQCNGTSTTCPFCCMPWNAGLLTHAGAAATGGPFLFQLTTGPAGPQMFSPAYLSAQAATSPVTAAQFFGAPPPNFRLPSATIAASPMVFKSASATMVLGEQQQLQAALDNQQMRRSLTSEPPASTPIWNSNRSMESCCNCGLQGHTRDTCAEPTLDDMTSSGHFHLNFSAKDDSVSTSQDR